MYLTHITIYHDFLLIFERAIAELKIVSEERYSCMVASILKRRMAGSVVSMKDVERHARAKLATMQVSVS